MRIAFESVSKICQGRAAFGDNTVVATHVSGHESPCLFSRRSIGIDRAMNSYCS